MIGLLVALALMLLSIAAIIKLIFFYKNPTKNKSADYYYSPFVKHGFVVDDDGNYIETQRRISPDEVLIKKQKD